MTTITRYTLRMASSSVREVEHTSPYGLRLPPNNIRQLSEEDVGGRDLLIVGDVHGCYDELVDLFTTNDVTKENTCVVFVGDLVNKGPKSLEVVEYVMQNGWYSVRGNHDEICLMELKQSKDEKQDPPPKFKWTTELSEKSQEWLHHLPYAIHIPSMSLIVVHGGLLPDLPLEEQTPDMFLHIRCVRQTESGWDWIRTYKEEDGYKLWGEAWAGPDHVYFGHDAKRLFQEHKYATGLDTACVYGVQLTAIYPLGKQVINIKSREKYSGKDKNKYDGAVVKHGQLRSNITT